MRYILVVLVLFTINLKAQVVKVFDRTNGKPVNDAQITLSDKIFVTNEQGIAILQNVNVSDGIIITAVGYEKAIINNPMLENDTLFVGLVPNIFDIGEVVILGNKWEQKTDEVPITVRTVPISDIDMTNPQTSADLLGNNGHVFIQKSQLGGGSPMIRGFAANHILIVVDGIRMNNAIYRSGNLQNVISIDPNSLDEVEVVFGPGSVIYGSDALGGVMDFHTKIPHFSEDKISLHTSGLLRFSSADNEKTTNLNFTISAKKIASFTSFSFSDFGDMKMGSYGPDEYLRPEYVVVTENGDYIEPNIDPQVQKFSGYKAYNFLQKLNFKISENWKAKYGFYFSTTSNIPRYDRLIQYKGSTLKYAQWYYGPQKWMMNRLAVENSSSNAVYDNLKINFAWQDYTESRHDRKFGKDEIRERTEHLSVYSVNLNAFKNINKFTLYYGIEGNYNIVHSVGQKRNIYTGEIESYASRYPDGSQYSNADAYLMLRYVPNSKIIINTGTRYSYVNAFAKFDTTFYHFPFLTLDYGQGAFTYSAGVSFLPGNNWNLAINTASGFRAPNIDDFSKVFDSEPGNVIVPNPNLKSEYLYDVDFRIRNETSHYFFSLTSFFSYLDNAIVRSDYTLNGQDSIIYDGTMSKVEALVNTGYAVIYGMELEAGVEIVKNLILKYSTTTIIGHDDKNNSIRHIPPYNALAHLIYSKGKIKTDLFAVYNAEIPYDYLAPSERAKPHIYAVDNNGNPYCPQWWTLNFRLQYRFADYLHLNFGVENIFDKRYRPYSSGIVAPGRNFVFSVKFNM